MSVSKTGKVIHRVLKSLVEIHFEKIFLTCPVLHRKEKQMWPFQQTTCQHCHKHHRRQYRGHTKEILLQLAKHSLQMKSSVHYRLSLTESIIFICENKEFMLQEKKGQEHLVVIINLSEVHLKLGTYPLQKLVNFKLSCVYMSACYNVPKLCLWEDETDFVGPINIHCSLHIQRNNFAGFHLGRGWREFNPIPK